MLVAGDEIGPILRGELTEIRMSYNPPKVGTIQGVQGGVGKRARAWVLIEEVQLHEDGGHLVRFRLHHRRAQPRLLRPHYGYTTEPEQSMRYDAGIPEPEALTEEELATLAATSRRRTRDERAQRRKTQELLDLEQRIATWMREASRRRIDIRSELRLARQLRDRGKSLENVATGIRRKLDRDVDAE